MIFDLSITPASVTEISEAKLSGAAILVQRLLAETIRAHGAVKFGSSEEAREFLDHVRSPLLSEAERKLWQELLIELRLGGRLAAGASPSPQELASVTDVGMLKKLRAGNSDHLFVLPNDQFETMFPHSVSKSEAPIAGLSVATAMSANDTDIVIQRRALSARGAHPQGYSREAVWKELFESVVRFSGEIVIVDRYLFNELVTRESDGNSAEEHLVWLLRRIALDARPGVRVSLIAGTHKNPKITDPRAIADLILRRWGMARGSIAEFRIVLASGKFPHNRHIRFGGGTGSGRGVGYDLYEGMDRLKSPALWDVDGFAWRFRWRAEALESMRARERRMADSTSARATAVTF